MDWKAKLLAVAAAIEAAIVGFSVAFSPTAEIWTMPPSYQAGSMVGEVLLWWILMLLPVWIYRKIKTGREKGKSEQA